MQEEIKSEGKCLFCGETFAKAGINKHLSAHLKERTKESENAGCSFLVKVETDKRWGATPYFLSLWVDGETTMKTIDQFLRDIWLECCGHLSEFENVAMTKKARNVFAKGMKLDYEYDFGSSTQLTLTTVEEYPMKADKKIVLLSRNEPEKVLCAMCGKEPATKICPFCVYERPAWFCDKCAKKHAKKCEDFDENEALPVVNSPRMGVCAYSGGSIDMERDGAF